MRPFCLCTLMLAACQDYTIKGNGDVITGTDETGEPNIVVDPTSIAFGSVNVGADSTSIQPVTVSNTGDAALEINGLSLQDGVSVFTLSAIGSVLVPPGSSTTFTVTYEPDTAFDYEDTVLIDSNDPDSPEVPVDLTGTGVAPEIQVSPETYDFGTIYIGCDNTSPTIITNVGNADLVVSDFNYVSASNDLYFDPDTATNGDLPWTLAPGESHQVYVGYAPLDDYSDEGYLTVTSNDPFQPEAQAHQTAGGDLFGSNLDVFEQPLRGSSDILFIVDNSCSMADEQALLADNFSYFAAGLVDLDIDYQIAVITTDNPVFQGDIMTPETSDLESEFIAQTSVGTAGSGTEMPTEMAYQSAQSGGDAGPGGDFLRDDAMLSMIFVSDEPDSSTGRWADYLDYFESLKSDSDNLVINAISGDWPAGCADASATNNVYEMSVATGGLYLSVCATDWASHLEALVNASVEDLSSFELTSWPVPETIVVTVDGVTETTGWTYNSTSNTVDFDESTVPEGGSTIEVEYALYGDCEE